MRQVAMGSDITDTFLYYVNVSRITQWNGVAHIRDYDNIGSVEPIRTHFEDERGAIPDR